MYFLLPDRLARLAIESQHDELIHVRGLLAAHASPAGPPWPIAGRAVAGGRLRWWSILHGRKHGGKGGGRERMLAWGRVAHRGGTIGFDGRQDENPLAPDDRRRDTTPWNRDFPAHVL